MLQRYLLLSLVCALIVACASTTIDDPIAKMLERGEDPGVRLLAAKQAAAEMPTDPRRIEADAGGPRSSANGHADEYQRCEGGDQPNHHGDFFQAVHITLKLRP